MNVVADPIPPQQGEAIFNEALRIFVDGGDRRWWWESFKRSPVSHKFAGGDGWRRLPELVPDPNEPVWFIAEENALPFYPVFELTPADASTILGECYGFEFYLMPKNYSWLLCENHHNTVFALGEPVSSRLRSVSI